MIRFLLSVLLSTGLCLPMMAQQSQSVSNSSNFVEAAPTGQMANAQQSSAASERIQAIRNARSIHIESQTVFLTKSTLERASS